MGLDGPLFYLWFLNFTFSDMGRELAETIHALCAPAIEAAGYELVDVEWKREQHGWVCRLFIDCTGGVSHVDCERVSREVSALLDVHDVIPHAYHLEVSSPGLNRPLRTLEHFRRQIGKLARARLKTGIDGRRNFLGTILSVDDEGHTVTLDVDGKQYILPVSDLDRANLEYRFD